MPGGAGVSEGMLYSIFTMAFTEKMADTGMLLTRTFVFYIPLIACGLTILINFFTRKSKEKKEA